MDSNNENSVPKDFENIDNSNFGARSQPQRRTAGHGRGRLGEGAAPAPRGTGKASDEVIHYDGAEGASPGPNRTRSAGTGRAGGSQQPEERHRRAQPAGKPAPSASQITYEQPPKCEIGGKEAISALSRAKSKECRQQIAEVYCRHKEGRLMPEKVTRYCPLEGECSTFCPSKSV